MGDYKNRKTEKVLNINLPVMLAFLFVIVLWALSLYFVWAYKPTNTKDGGFPLLNPRLASLTYSSIEERRAKTFSNLMPLKKELLTLIDQYDDNIFFYTEDLNTGAWIGFSEREPVIAASLLKIPVAIGAMKKVDRGDWTLDTKFNMDAKYKDENFGSLWKMEDGSEITLRKLIEEMLQYSDNTAANIIFDNLNSSEREEIYYHIGIENPEAPFEQSASRPVFKKLAARDFASMFRALYNATYLTRASSEFILSTLTETKFDKIISREIPEDVKVAHKIANFFTGDLDANKSFHDCGIVYLTEHPYFYCVLTKGLNAADAKDSIVKIGDKVYKYFYSGNE